jgi:hypothetical protein
MASDNGAKQQFNPFNKQKYKALERLVCSYLIESLTASGIETVMLICRAGLLLPPKETADLQLNQEAINNVYTVAERIHSAAGSPVRQHDEYPVYLADLDFEDAILPWLGTSELSYYANGLDHEELEEASYETRMRVIISRLSDVGHRSLRSNFLNYAMPFAQGLGGVLTSMISPETYSDMLMTYKGVKNA